MAEAIYQHLKKQIRLKVWCILQVSPFFIKRLKKGPKNEGFLDLFCALIELSKVGSNAFPPQPKDATANDGLDEVRDDLTPPAYLKWAEQWQTQGASLIGGCCGIGPEHIHALSQHFTSTSIK